MTIRTALAVLCCFLSVVLGLVLAKPGGQAVKAGGKTVIGLSLDTLKEERWQHDRDLIVQAAAELGAEVLVQAANSDDTRQIQDVEALISRKVDALIIVPHNGDAMGKAVRLAHEAGIPVIAYDRLIPNAGVDLHVAFDAVEIGRAQARWLAAHLAKGRATKLVRIHGAKTDHNSHLVKRGQDEILAPLFKSGAVKTLHEDWADNWKPENAKKIMNAALTNHGNGVDAVLAANDGTAGGAIQALLEEGLAGKVLVLGQDAELAACQRVARGTQSMTIYKPLKLEAATAAAAAVKLARRQVVVAKQEVADPLGPVPAILMEVTAVDKSNLMETVVKDGFHSKEAVFGK